MMQDFNSGGNDQDLKSLGEGFKLLPYNLQNLKLDL